MQSWFSETLVGCGCVFLIYFITFLFGLLNVIKTAPPPTPPPTPPAPPPTPPAPRSQLSDSRILSYQALADATNGFDAANIVGRGGFGPVHRGELDGRAVAVKVLEDAGGQGMQEFQREVDILSRCRHENIVPLLACAMTPGRPLCLVYAFMEGGALSDALRNPAALSADQRLRVAEDVARGLAYLHEQDVVHRDIKSANILLDGEGRARVADAGLARDVNAQTTTMTRGLAVGSPGYLDPEYAETYQVTTASDVFSYGVVLLELLTGLPAFDSNQRPPPLAKRLRRHLPEVDADEVFRGVGASLGMALGTLAKRCIARESEERPTAAAVLQEFAPMRAAGLIQPPAAAAAPEPAAQRECLVCMEALPNTRFLPCLHSTACVRCAAELIRRGQGCPICRAPMEQFEVGEFPATLTGLDDDGVRVEYQSPIFSLPIDDDGAPAPVRTSTFWDDIFFSSVVVALVLLGILVVLLVLLGGGLLLILV